MELSHKTTILLSDKLYQHLTRIAATRHTSMGCLVREACELQYGTVSPAKAVRAVQALAGLALPVDDVAEMKRQMVPSPDELLR